MLLAYVTTIVIVVTINTYVIVSNYYYVTLWEEPEDSAVQHF